MRTIKIFASFKNYLKIITQKLQNYNGKPKLNILMGEENMTIKTYKVTVPVEFTFKTSSDTSPEKLAEIADMLLEHKVHNADIKVNKDNIDIECVNHDTERKFTFEDIIRGA